MTAREDSPGDPALPITPIAPMLAQTGPLPASDEGWAYEFKWDGVRAVTMVDAHSVDGNAVRASSRGAKDFTRTFPELHDLTGSLAGRSAMLDGEIVAFDDDGRPSFGRLQQRLNLGSLEAVARRAQEVAASYLVFDLLWLDGRALLEDSYDVRRDLLESLELAGPSFAVPPSFRTAHGADVLAAAESSGLEGIVAKRRASRYRPGMRSPDWIKLKLVKMQEVVIGGWTDGVGERAGSLGALLLGVHVDGRLRYAGKVGTGFDARSRRELLAELGPLATTANPFESEPPGAALAHFVAPVLVGEVTYAEWTSGGHLRHTAWRGRRVDKTAAEVVREP